MPCAKNNLTAVLAVFVVRVFVRPHRALHVALDGQGVVATAERQRPYLARTSVVLAGSRPAEKLSLK